MIQLAQSLRARAVLLHIPHAHLLHEQDLIVLVLRPAHVEQIRFVLAFHNVLHEWLLSVIMETRWEVIALQCFHLRIGPVDPVGRMLPV